MSKQAIIEGLHQELSAHLSKAFVITSKGTNQLGIINNSTAMSYRVEAQTDALVVYANYNFSQALDFTNLEYADPNLVQQLIEIVKAGL